MSGKGLLYPVLNMKCFPSSTFKIPCPVLSKLSVIQLFGQLCLHAPLEGGSKLARKGLVNFYLNKQKITDRQLLVKCYDIKMVVARVLLFIGVPPCS